MKKVLSLVLVIAMVLSSMSFAFASTFTDIADIDYEEAIETLEALGVITGYEDGTYRPEKTVTRAEMAKLMVELLGYGSLVSGSKSNFTDTQGHWADQWIALAAGRGIVIGTGDGKFNPDGIVTYDQVLTMLVRGLGYTDSSNELKNMSWPTNFKVKAAELNITKNVDMSSNNADRGGVAQAMYNALDQQLVKVNSDGDIVKEFTTKGTKTDIPVNLITRIATPDYAFEVGFEHIDPSDKNYAGDKVDLTGYLFQTVEAYFSKNNDKEIVFIGDVDSLTYTDTFEDETFKDGKLKSLEIGDYVFDVATASVSYNNAEAKIADFAAGDLEDAKFTVVLDDEETRIKDDAVAKGLIIEKASAYVQVEEEYKADATEIDEIYLPVKSSKVDTSKLIVKGDVSDLDDIKVDDIVAAYAPFDNEDPTIEAPDKLTLVVSRKTIQGEVTGTKGSDRYIDKVLYEVNPGLNMDELERGDEGTFYLDDNGKIIAFSGDSEGSKTYAVVDDDININGEFKKSASTGRYSITEVPEIKLDTASDETITYKFDIELDSDGTIKNDDLAGLFEVKLNAGSTTEGIIEYTGSDLFDIVGSDAFGKLVSYTLNDDNEISKFSVTGRTINDVSTSSSSFVLASNVVIFDREGNVIKEADLGSKVTGTAVYQNGKIVALLTDKSAEGTKYFAYITAVNDDRDDDNNDVQRLTAFVKGAKNTNLFTDDDDVVGNKNKYYELEINDNGLVIAADSVADNEFSGVVTASAIDTKAGELTIDGKTYYFDEGAATIIKFNEDDEAELVGKLSAIKKGETEFKFLLTGAEADRVIGYIVIQ